MIMRLFTCCTFILFFGIGVNGICADSTFKSEEEFSNWMAVYYQNPSPEKVPLALKYFSDSALYNTNATMPTVAFFSALFKKNTTLMQKTFEDVAADGSENAKVMLVNILSLANSPESNALLEKAKNIWQSDRLQQVIARQMAHPHDDLYSIAVDSPQVLDMLWASFFATGEDIPIKRIISVLHLEKDGHGEMIMVGGAANWSLGANAKQCPKVLQICKSELANSRGVTKELLEKIIEGAMPTK